MEKPVTVAQSLTERESQYVLIYVASRLENDANFKKAFAEAVESAQEQRK